jgi:tetratricopeptide (TPR) repeat protein
MATSIKRDSISNAPPNHSETALTSANAIVTRWRIALLVITLLVLLPVLRNGFLSWDDNQHIIDNPLLRSGRVSQFWMRPYFGLYIPVTYSIWTLIAVVNGGGPLDSAGFHAINLIVHAGTVLIVFEIIRRLTKQTFAAAVGAILFAVHPLQVEPVAWISGFRDVLGGFWALLAIWQFLIARDGVPMGAASAAASSESPSRFRRSEILHYVIATLAFVLAILSKPTTLITPVICFILDRQNMRRLVATGWLVLWLLLGGAAALITRAAQPPIAPHPLGIFDRISVAGDAISFYLMKLALPISLGVDYGRTPAMVLSRPFWMSAAEFLLPLIVIVLAWKARVRFPLLWRGLLAALIAILPVLGFVSFDFQKYSTVADRYMYLPLLGIAVAVASFVPALARIRYAIPVLGVLLVTFAARSFAQVFVWHDGGSLFSHALAVNNRSAMSCSQLASLWLDAGNPVEAQKWAQQAVDRDPEPALPYVTYGLAASRRVPPDLVTAQNAYRTALAHDPNMLSALTNLAALLAQQGDLAEAHKLCQRAIAIEPSDVSAHINLGNILAAQGKTANAQSEYAAAVAISPENQQAETNWAALLAQSGNRAEAQAHLQRALQIDPNYPPALRLMNLMNRNR